MAVPCPPPPNVIVRERAHIRIDVIFEFVSPRMKALLYLFGDLVMLVVACFALYWSWESVAVSLKFGSVSHGLRGDGRHWPNVGSSQQPCDCAHGRPNASGQ